MFSCMRKSPIPKVIINIINTSVYGVTIKIELDWNGKENIDSSIKFYIIHNDEKKLKSFKNQEIQFTELQSNSIHTIKVQCENKFGDNTISNELIVKCPQKPPPPELEANFNVYSDQIIIKWMKPHSMRDAEAENDICFYKVYLDNEYLGEVDKKDVDENGYYKFPIPFSYRQKLAKLNVKSFAGEKIVEGTYHKSINCISESTNSNLISNISKVQTQSIKIEIEEVSSKRVILSWKTSKKANNLLTKGYYLVKNGNLYGSLIPPDENSVELTDCIFGEFMSLQIVQLYSVDDTFETLEQPKRFDSFLSVPLNTYDLVNMLIKGSYILCRIGEILEFRYEEINLPINSLKIIDKTENSVAINWKVREDNSYEFFRENNTFMVKWWPGEQSIDNLKSAKTSGNSFKIKNLRNNCSYTAIVESIRKENNEKLSSRPVAFIETSPSVTFHMFEPKIPIIDLKVVDCSKDAIKVQWELLRKLNVDAVKFRIDCLKRNVKNSSQSIIILDAKETIVVIENLQEKTEYEISFTALTKEFLEYHPNTKLEELCNCSSLPENIWLPSMYIVGSTSGADPPKELHVTKVMPKTVMLSWQQAQIYGSYTHLGYLVKWTEVDASGNCQVENNYSEKAVASNNAVITDLRPDAYYKFYVEALISARISLHSTDSERTKLILPSNSIVFKMMVLCPPSKLFLTGFTSNDISVAWKKPVLFVDLGLGPDGTPKYKEFILKHYILLVNGKRYAKLDPTKREFTIDECKNGNDYTVVLVSVTTPKPENDVDSDSRTSQSSKIDEDSENSLHNNPMAYEQYQEAQSNEIFFTQPSQDELQLHKSSITFLKSDDQDNGIDKMLLKWDLQNSNSDVKKIDITWGNALKKEERQTKSIQTNKSEVILPVVGKSQYQCATLTFFKKNDRVAKSTSIDLQCVLPDKLLTPSLYVSKITPYYFTVEWDESDLWDIKENIYQLYVDSKKSGDLLQLNQRLLQITRPKKDTKNIQLQAISKTENVDNSRLSNIIEVLSLDTEEIAEIEKNLLESMTPFIVSPIKVTDSKIHLSWVSYEEDIDLNEYELAWHWEEDGEFLSKWAKFRKGDKNCVIYKCQPGTTYYISLYALDNQNTILNKSDELCVVTAAIPEQPYLKLLYQNLESITVCWAESIGFGSSFIKSFRVIVNGVLEAKLPPTETSFKFDKTVPKNVYTFQVQAVTDLEHFKSDLSEPLEVIAPAFIAPTLDTHSSSVDDTIKVYWKLPPIDNFVINDIKLVCLDEETNEEVQVISHLGSSVNEAELKHLDPGIYNIYLEIHVNDSEKIFKSEILRKLEEIKPYPPTISLSIPDLQNRIRCEEIIAELINERDHLMTRINDQCNLNAERATRSLLSRTDYRLGVYLRYLKCNSKKISIHLKWVRAKENPDAPTSGFKILIDNKPFGPILNKKTNNLKFYIKPRKKLYKLAIVAICGMRRTISDLSNKVELETEMFLPFYYYSFFDTIKLSYTENYKKEKLLPISKTLKTNFLPWKTSLSSMSAVNIFSGKVTNLIPLQAQKYPTALLFWSNLNSYSFKVLKWMAKYAETSNSEGSFKTILSSNTIISNAERETVANKINQSICKKDNFIKHYVCNSPTFNEGCSRDILSYFGIHGVPTIIILHSQNNIVWKGRYCARNYENFKNFLLYVMSSENNRDIKDPWRKNSKKSAGIKQKKQILHKRERVRSARATLEETDLTEFSTNTEEESPKSNSRFREIPINR